ncbi:MAG TPA: hypothetical protein PKO15_15570 [Fibrobacteria bacterium]|nr:hypothetical protein [Fibrobacteria bacterium]
MIPHWRPLGLALLTLGCSFGDRESGKGVITETTNGVTARGRLVAPDSLPIRSGTIRAVIDEDVPEAWNGHPRSASSVGSDGSFELRGLDKPRMILLADATTGKGAYGSSRSIHVHDSDFRLPDLAMQPRERLAGSWTSYDSALAALPSGWFLRITVRGLPESKRLDAKDWVFDSLPPGTWHVRIQAVDGVPGHETTLWRDSLPTSPY